MNSIAAIKMKRFEAGMYQNYPGFLCTLVILLLVPISAGAASAPVELRGKSVLVSWSEQRVQRIVGEGSFRSVNASHELSIYISSVGRVFSKFQASTRRGTGANEQVAGQGNRVPSFSGHTMAIVQPAEGIARRVAAEFNDGFTSCTASVIRGKSGTGSGFATSLINGQRIEIQSVTTSGATCSVKAGNVFEGQ